MLVNVLLVNSFVSFPSCVPSLSTSVVTLYVPTGIHTNWLLLLSSITIPSSTFVPLSSATLNPPGIVTGLSKSSFIVVVLSNFFHSLLLPLLHSFQEDLVYLALPP